jgi:hypothetical protein
MPLLNEQACDCTPDIPCTAGNENLHKKATLARPV